MSSERPLAPPVSLATAGELRDVAIELATRAGQLAAAMRAENAEVAHTKSNVNDVVTAADMASEALLRTELARLRPGDGVLGEEEGLVPGTSGLTWVLDPIDGTVNYLYGLEQYAVSVAVVAGDPWDVRAWTPIAGCVHAPALDRTWAAARGHGATCDGAPVRVSEPAGPTTSLVATGFSYDPAVRAEQGEIVARLLPRVRDVRRMGSAALDLAAVSAGRVDAYFERGVWPWDVAAGALLVTEAGGVVRWLGAQDAVPGALTVLAAGPSVIDSIAALLG